jgi:hypothetical protein
VKKEVVAEGADVKAAPAAKKVAVKKVAAEKAPKAEKATESPEGTESLSSDTIKPDPEGRLKMYA